MASMRDIKRRKESVQSTQQITKAMKLVSTVKLQKARGRAESNKPYFNMLYDTICSILAMTKEPNHKFLKENGSDKKAVIAITSNRGLAGGYNNNVVKEIVAAGFSKEDTYIYGIGRVVSNRLLDEAGVSPDTRVKDLTDDEVARIQKAIETLEVPVEGDLRREVALNIKRLQEIGCYRGIRHRKGLPVRGQKTKTNARTRKGPKKTIANKKK